MAISSPLMPPFPPIHLEEELRRHSQVEHDRLQHTASDFDEQVYQHAVALVLRKLAHDAAGEAR